jgi:hypothetical protein
MNRYYTCMGRQYFCIGNPNLLSDSVNTGTEIAKPTLMHIVCPI